MIKNLTIFYKEGYQQLNDNLTCLYATSDEWTDPDDIIDCDDASDLIELGIKYAKEGYTSIHYDCVDIPKEEDIEEFIEDYFKEK